MKRALSASALLVAFASGADGQIIRPVSVNRHSAYTSISAGWLRQQAICDPASKACWTFDGAPQYRASFELPVSQSTSIGISYSNAQIPLRWADTPPNTANCAVCDANGEMNQILGVIHLGGSGVLQQVIDISAGATQFGNFRTTTGTPLGTGKRVTDFSFALAFGFGFALGRNLQGTLQQEYGLVVHKRVSGSSNSSAQQQALRLGLRLGL